MIRWAVALGVLLAAALPLPAAAQGGPPVVVASKADTEGALLGHMMVALLEHAGVPVRVRLQLGSTRELRAAILAGAVDLYPEYTGNGALFFAGKDKDPAWRDPADAYALAVSLDAANGISWLTPAPANNAWGVAIHRDVADAARVSTFEDFARYLAGGGRLKLAASAEFVESPAALPALQATYGFRLSPSQIVQVPGGDTAQTLMMAWEGRDGVNAAMAYGTDGLLPTVNLVFLTDTKGAQAVFAPTPVIRTQVLDRHPRIRDLLAAPFQALSNEMLQRLNSEISVNGEEPQKVARDWLALNGFLPAEGRRR